jgi:hypothetical protein
MLAKDSWIVILMKRGHQHDDEEDTENKMQGFWKQFLLRELVHQNLGN